MIKVFINNHTLYRIAVFAILISCFGCSKTLDIIPKDQVSDAVLWSSEKNADLFLNNIYGFIQQPFNQIDPWENFTDNALGGIAGVYSISVMGTGSYTPSTGPNLWRNYVAIREANVFIKNVTASNLSEDWKKVRLAEARFLRAFYYSQLWTYYGGVPVITEVLNREEQGDGIFYSRSTFEETYKFIADELTAIIADLDVKPETGRASRGAALATKAWCELFFASPLNNSANDLQRWAQAAQTYKQIADLNVYDLFPDHKTLFWEENNNNIEVIFDKALYRNNGMTGYWGTTFAGNNNTGFGTSMPTQELVDDYCMENGLPISDPLSGYDPENPYVNREQRFYDDIIHDGADWLGYEVVMKQGVGSKNATDLSSSSQATNTGYYWRKMMNPNYAIINNLDNSAHWIIFRYAEILLGYAEAQNEAVGPDQSVYDAVQKVRSRVNLPSLRAGLSQGEMRETIWRERRVELALEGKRWLDLTRLKLSDQKLNHHFLAVVIEQVNGSWKYRYVPASEGLKVFHPEKNYWFPIPQTAMDQNSKLVQNPEY